MTTLLITQPEGDVHETPSGHPERQERLAAIATALGAKEFDGLKRETAQTADLGFINLAHDADYLNRLQALRPAAGISEIDADTFISPQSLNVAATGLGAGLRALEAVAHGEVNNAFCAIRPPGHHAEHSTPMGFCLINTVAILARAVQKLHGAEKVAIVDFDVHHGNGTQDIFKNDPSVMYASSHEMPLYPGTGGANETGVGNIFNLPLGAGSGGEAMRAAYSETIMPALAAFDPDFVLISAGFDAHERDPLAHLNWTGDDYAWLTAQLLEFAEKQCGGRVVSLLEGGYDLTGLAESVAQHVRMMSHGVAAQNT